MMHQKTMLIYRVTVAARNDGLRHGKVLMSQKTNKGSLSEQNVSSAAQRSSARPRAGHLVCATILKFVRRNPNQMASHPIPQGTAQRIHNLHWHNCDS
jgi:hypothetical protein